MHRSPSVAAGGSAPRASSGPRSPARPAPPPRPLRSRDVQPALLRVAVLGAGTVGGPVVRALLERADRLAPFDGARRSLAGVADKFMDRVIERGCPRRARDRRAGPPRRGSRGRRDRGADGRRRAGPHPDRGRARRRARRSSPPTSTSSRTTARSSRRSPGGRRGAFRFEAAVGGGTPVLSPLAADLAANDVRAGPRHRQRDDQLHPHRDARAGQRVRTTSWPRRRPAATRRPIRAATSRATTPSTRS